MRRGFWVYWFNPTYAKTGYVEYTTISKERAVELFYKDFDETYIIVHIHD